MNRLLPYGQNLDLPQSLPNDICHHTRPDTKFVKEAIYSGNLWGFAWKMPGIFHDEESTDRNVQETCDILDMWERLEESFSNLNPEDRDWLAKNADPFGKDVKFDGFDGNNEGEYISVARFLIEQLDRYQHFKGRNLNAHMPTIETHRRMVKVFKPILQQVSNRDFTAGQIAEVLNARKALR